MDSALPVPEGAAVRWPLLRVRLRPTLGVGGRGGVAAVLRARSVRGLSTAAVCRGRSPGRGAVLETSSAFALSFGHTMRRLGSVQRKMPCVFVTEVKEEPSTKREHQVPRCAAPWSGRAGAAGRYRAALQVGSFFAIFAGEVWDTGLYSPSSRFSYLVSCKGGNLREKFSDEAIQTCRLVEIESPHLK